MEVLLEACTNGGTEFCPFLLGGILYERGVRAYRMEGIILGRQGKSLHEGRNCMREGDIHVKLLMHFMESLGMAVNNQFTGPTFIGHLVQIQLYQA